MQFARSAGDRSRRPMLLALVFGVALVLVGVTASALVAIASMHVRSATLQSVVERDAALAELFVNASLRASDLDADGPGAGRARTLADQLGHLASEDGIVRIEIRDPSGEVLASDDREVIGQTAAGTAAMRDAAERGLPGAELLTEADGTTGIDAIGSLPGWTSLVQEYLPIVGDSGETLGVVAIWRDAADLVSTIDIARRDVMLVTLAAAALLSGVLFLVFRSAQARLTGQHRLLMESTRRDALTGMLNHGAVVGLLAEALESARIGGNEIGVALVDVDNFRLFNDTHGHAAADQVLKEVAAVVEAEGTGGQVARYGPDEFLLFRPGADVAEMQAAAHRLRRALEAVSVQFGESERLPISASVGICAYPQHASSVTDLLSVAAVALAEAKASGGDGIRVAEVGEEERTVWGSFDVLQGLVLAVDTKDRYTKRHSEDVARYAVFLASRLGLDEEMQKTVHLAGLLHDVGKIGIPDVILRKPSKLTADEYGMFHQHVALGDAIVRDVPNAELVRGGIRHHHERWDGSGYLDGLAGEEIPFVARIISVADTYSAMTTTRPYRKALPVDEAVRRLRDAAGTQLQPELVDAFVEGIETDADAPAPGEDPATIWRPELWVA